MFRGLDIGTAKATAADRARVPHHGLDLVDPDQPFSVADFAAHARGRPGDSARGMASPSWSAARGCTCAPSPAAWTRLPCRAIRTCAPGSRRTSRRRSGALVDRLEVSRRPGWTTIDLRNPRRVVRALEIGELRAIGRSRRPAATRVRRLDRARWRARQHRDRIAARARAQFDAGLIEEARALRERFDPTLPAFSAIGYREAWAVIDGELTRAAAIELDARRNVQFAKRQATWFRGEPGITWLDPSVDADTIVARSPVREVLADEPR